MILLQAGALPCGRQRLTEEETERLLRMRAASWVATLATTLQNTRASENASGERYAKRMTKSSSKWTPCYWRAKWPGTVRGLAARPGCLISTSIAYHYRRGAGSGRRRMGHKTHIP